MDDTLHQQIIANVLRDWCGPEIQRRRAAGELPADFVWSRVLILPGDGGVGSSVKFDREFAFAADVKLSEGVRFEAGHEVDLHEVDTVVAVHAPRINERRVAFIYLESRGDTWRLAFDFSPNHPGYEEPVGQWDLSDFFVEILNERHLCHVLGAGTSLSGALLSAGIWPAPAILPQPFARMLDAFGRNDLEAVSSILVSHCDGPFMVERMQHWWSAPCFDRRRWVFECAVEAFQRKEYGLFVYAVTPQIEGVVTDWLYDNPSGKPVRYKATEKNRQFSEAVSKTVISEPHTTIVAECLAFLKDGPAFKHRDWPDAVESSFVMRNAIAHGRVDRQLFTELNCVKLFLLIDGLHWMASRGSLPADAVKDLQSDRNGA